MQFEVEQKYPVGDEEQLLARLAEVGAKAEAAQLQVDQYFKHPARDFAQTDEALRTRRVGRRSWVTYKGPKLDKTTKTRREVELPLGGGQKGAKQFGELLVLLGFGPVAEVRKHRRKIAIDWEGEPIEGALDEVEDVGLFLELEILAEESNVEAAKKRLASLAKKLELPDSERRSYLELLLERTKGPSA